VGSFVALFVVGFHSKRKIEKFVNVVVKKKKRKKNLFIFFFQLASEARESQAPLVFATVFVIVWVGAGVVTVNALLLGGTMYTFNFIHRNVT
jgi:hypothetical protein